MEPQELLSDSSPGPVTPNHALLGNINMVFDEEGLTGVNSEHEMEDLSNSTTSTCSFDRPRISSTKAAVTVRNAVKQYGSGQPILNDFNMTVTKGTIYSLLGSSGCGKTTLLSCVVGVKHLNAGQVLVFGAKPGTKESGIPGNRIGYMPQDTALYNEFSIAESIYYFGKIYGMPNLSINASRDFLIEFLDLPEGHKIIGNLSGGQKRRVSLAVALVHSPELLILDEPTVGVDPLLRERKCLENETSLLIQVLRFFFDEKGIWNHLSKLVSTSKTTVIITTHYIEEARQSDMIGLMRGGRLLAEKNPATLLKEHNTNLLEDIVMKLCKKNTFGEDGGDKTITYEEARGLGQVNMRRPSMVDSKDKVLQKRRQSMVEEPILAFSNSGSLSRITAVVTKNVLMMMRNFLLLVFLIVTPAFLLCLLCIVTGGDPKGMTLGYVNLEKNYTEACPYPQISEVGCDVHNLACQFLSKIPSDLVYLKEYETEVAAREAVRHGSIWGFMSFPEQFSDNFYFRTTSGTTIDNATFDGSNISFEMDATSKQVALTLKRILFDTFKDFSQELLVNCGFNSQLAELPLEFRTPIYGTDNTDLKEYIAPGIMLAFIFFFPMCSSGFSYGLDKKQGTLERSMVAGVKIWEIMTAFFVTEGFVLIIQSGLSFVIILVLFGIEMQGSFVLAWCISILVGLSGVSMGFLAATVCNEQIEVALLSMASFFPNFFLAGFIWPLEALPFAVRCVSYILPCTLAAETSRSIVTRGWGFSHENVWPGFLSTFIWICIYWTLTTLILRRSSLTK